MDNDWRKRLVTRSIYQSSDLFTESNIKECVAWFLPKWAYYVARSFLFDYGQRRTSFAMDYRTGLYLLPDDSEFNEIDEVISEALGGDIMCVQDIVNAINGVSLAIQLSESSDCGGGDCSEGSGGAGPTDKPNSPFVDDGSTSFPPLFADRDEYEDNKCATARLIVQQMKADLVKIQTYDLATLVAGVFVAALFTPIPGDEIVAFVGGALVLFLGGLLVSTVLSVIAEVEANEEDIVCVMMQATTSQSAQEGVLCLLSGLGATSLLFASYFFNATSFNRLFEYGPTPEGFAPCPCVDDEWCDIFVQSGTVISSVPGKQIVVQSVATTNAQHVVVVLAKSECPEVSCSNVPIVTFDRQNHVHNPATVQFQFARVDDDCIELESCYGSNTPPTPQDNMAGSCVSNYLRFVSAVGSSMQITIDFLSNQ